MHKLLLFIFLKTKLGILIIIVLDQFTTVTKLQKKSIYL
ncbi:hypothetical protein P781_06155 [Vibrio mimicus CAIM 1883]|nr:hypothetical protein P781_06155 [Vibrio mimicus CAIM 1883]